MHKDSVSRTLLVALLLCVVCSVVVASAAVLLKPVQEDNKLLDKRKNILVAAGLAKISELNAEKVDALFENIEMRGVDIKSGEFVELDEDYSFQEAAMDPGASIPLKTVEDKASIRRQPKVMPVYLSKNAAGDIDKLILPVYGYGLWSTLYGFLAVESDFNTIAGLGFYQHGETPGLGGEVDNPKWKSQWPGKLIYEDGVPKVALAKGGVNPDSPDAKYQVDALSGATLTSRGVTNLLQFWLGDGGYGPFMQKFAKSKG